MSQELHVNLQIVQSLLKNEEQLYPPDYGLFFYNGITITGELS